MFTSFHRREIAGFDNPAVFGTLVDWVNLFCYQRWDLREVVFAKGTEAKATLLSQSEINAIEWAFMSGITVKPVSSPTSMFHLWSSFAHSLVFTIHRCHRTDSCSLSSPAPLKTQSSTACPLTLSQEKPSQSTSRTTLIGSGAGLLTMCSPSQTLGIASLLVPKRIHSKR